MNFAHLHTHTEYSIGDAIGTIPSLAARAVELGQEHLAITDHGHLYGLASMSKVNGLNIIPGAEIYVIDPLEEKRHQSSHLTVLAASSDGLRSLLALLTRASMTHYYYHPRTPIEEVLALKDCFILSGCQFGYCAKPLLAGNGKESRKRIQRFQEAFGDRFFLELQVHDDERQVQWNEYLLGMKGPHVVTNDVHYVRRPDYMARQVVIGGRVSRSDAREDAAKGLWLKSTKTVYEELSAQTGSKRAREIMDATVDVAKSCRVKVANNEYRVPGKQGRSMKRIREAVYRAHATRRERERLEEELKIIEHHQGYADFFWMVSEIVGWARERGYYVSNRGSAVSSFVLYRLGVTTLNPLHYNLPVYRFMSMERAQPPDIDLDTERGHRDEIHHHIVSTYGEDHVATLSNVGRYQKLSLINNLIRAHEKGYLPEFETVPDKEEFLDSLETGDWTDETKEFKPIIDALTDHASFLSVHAGGVVVSAKPIYNYTHLYRTLSTMVAAVDKYMAEDMGLMKLDLLVVDTLDTIRASCPKEVDAFALKPTEPEVYDWLNANNRNLAGVFQLTDVGQRAAEEIRPRNFEDLMAAITVIRPGSSSLEDYVGAKDGQPHIPKLFEPYLGRTYGAVVYQDQQMMMFKAAGFAPSDVERIMKLNKKRENQTIYVEEYARFYKMWMAGCETGGVDQDTADVMWRYMIEYSFNLGHALGYAYLTYVTLWLKTYHYLPFMVALFNNESREDKQRQIIRELMFKGVRLLPPDVNVSKVKHTIQSKCIRIGLGSLKYVGGAADFIVKHRKKHGDFTKESWEEFQAKNRKRVNARVVNVLREKGALPWKD